MLTFNALLRLGGLDPTQVRLVRHRMDDKIRAAAYEDAIAARAAFIEYQEMQSDPRVIEQFARARYLAAFVANPRNGETVFVGVWEVKGRRPPPAVDRYGRIPSEKTAAFATTEVESFRPYRGRLVINWGKGTRAWVQLAEQQDKPIVEVRATVERPKFPGYLDFREKVSRLDLLPPEWCEALERVKGIYLIVHESRGQQYVGSASGAGGFLGRWRCYTDGHAGNVGLQEIGAKAADLDVSILEVADMATPDVEVFARESRWKVKLGSRVVGLNRN